MNNKHFDELIEQCPYCGGDGFLMPTVSERQSALLREISRLGVARAGDLPEPGSTQRMAIVGLVEKGFVVERPYYGGVSRAHRFDYKLTEKGQLYLQWLKVSGAE